MPRRRQGPGPDALEAAAGLEPETSPRPHADAELPPPLELGAGAPGTSGHPGSTVRVARRGATALRGLQALAAWQARRRAAQARRRRFWLRYLVPPGAALLFALGYAGLRAAGVLDGEADLRVKAWAASGIQAGEHAEAAAWLEQSGHGLEGLEPEAARALVERLQRAGARAVYAARIRAAGRLRTASALIVELPASAAARRTVLWHCARARGPSAPLIPDRGERYHLLTWAR